MKKIIPSHRIALQRCCGVSILALATTLLTGCGGGTVGQPQQGFFTSGNKEADQRASQRMAQAEQLSGGKGNESVKKAEPSKDKAQGAAAGPMTGAAQAEGKTTLYQRLGGESGLTAIVNDFTARAIQDPRVNWDRKGVTSGGLFHHESVSWNPSPQNLAALKKHFVEFLALATGGPAKYEGGEMKAVHADMHITNPEFDAALGDLKASLDRLKVPNNDQKELLAVIETTRPQIVTER